MSTYTHTHVLSASKATFLTDNFNNVCTEECTTTASEGSTEYRKGKKTAKQLV